MKKLALIILPALLLLSACEATPQENNADTRAASETTTAQITINEPAAKTYSEADQIAYSGAMQQSKVEICDKIEDQQYAEKCKNDVTNQIAYTSAVNKYDITLCENITDEERKKACIMKIEVDLMDPGKKDQKLYNEIAVNGLYEKCDELNDEWWKNLCEINSIVDKAKEMKNHELCYQLEEKHQKTCQVLVEEHIAAQNN
jgi:hypothetical protein